MSGGLGLRLRPYTENDPKSMIKVGKRPIAEWQIQWLRSHGIKHVIFAIGHRGEKMVEYFAKSNESGMRIEFSLEQEPLGTAGALRKSSSLIAEDMCVVLNGDVITDLNLQTMVQLHLKLQTKTTMAVVPYISSFGIVEVTPAGKVAGFVEKPRIPDTYINGGVYVLNRDVVTGLPEKGDLEGTVFPDLASKGDIGSYLHDGDWMSIDNVKDVLTAQRKAPEWENKITGN